MIFIKFTVLALLFVQAICSFVVEDEVIEDKGKAHNLFRKRFEDVGIILPEDDSSSVQFRIPDDRQIEETEGFQPIVVETQEETKYDKKPAFCNDLDCPKYKLLKKYDDYEERLYLESNWVSTTMQDIKLDEASRMMFFKLFNYIQGANVDKQKIAMTAPVITNIQPGQGPACVNNFTMSFYMTSGSAPKPTDKAVFLDGLRQQRVFVRSFGGFAEEKQWVQNAKVLSKALKRDKQEFDSGFFYSAGYDSPFRILDRHNEVWYIASK